MFFEGTATKIFGSILYNLQSCMPRLICNMQYPSLHEFWQLQSRGKKGRLLQKDTILIGFSFHCPNKQLFVLCVFFHLIQRVVDAMGCLVPECWAGTVAKVLVLIQWPNPFLRAHQIFCPPSSSWLPQEIFTFQFKVFQFKVFLMSGSGLRWAELTNCTMTAQLPALASHV